MQMSETVGHAALAALGLPEHAASTTQGRMGLRGARPAGDRSARAAVLLRCSHLAATPLATLYGQPSAAVRQRVCASHLACNSGRQPRGKAGGICHRPVAPQVKDSGSP